MDIMDMRVIITVLSFGAFIGIVVWAYSGRQKKRFDEAANLPFADDEMQQRTIERSGGGINNDPSGNNNNSAGQSSARTTSREELPHG